MTFDSYEHCTRFISITTVSDEASKYPVIHVSGIPLRPRPDVVYAGTAVTLLTSFLALVLAPRG